MSAIVDHGCVVCRKAGFGVTPAEVHHILRHGQRIDHLHTLPLCTIHHRQPTLAERAGEVARHPTKAAFERRYGTELELLAELREALA